MSAKHVAGAVVLTLVGLPLGADNAQARGGGSSGSASSGQHHHGGGGGGSSSSSSSSGSSGSSSASSGSSYSREGGSSGGSRSRSAQSDAQRRHPRPGTGHGSFGSRSRYSPYYYRPYSYGYYGYYPSWYSGYYGGYYGGYYDNPYSYGAYRSPYYSGGYRSRYRSGDVGSLRLLVDPADTRVYVDGYFAGNVDDFDGLFQRLNLSRGRHDLTFKLEGHRTYRMRVYVPSEQTLKIHYDMVRGTGEDIREEALGVPEDDRNDDRWARRERGDRDEDQADDDDVRDRDREADRNRDQPADSPEAAPRPSGGRGMVMLEVEPADASIYVDGEFRGAARQARSLELSEGRHRVEVVRPGYKTFEREVEVRAGRSEVVQVTLDRP